MRDMLYEEALKYYEMAKSESPKSVASLFGTMACYIAMADLQGASKQLQ
jgi:hypothetical protein